MREVLKYWGRGGGGLAFSKTRRSLTILHGKLMGNPIFLILRAAGYETTLFSALSFQMTKLFIHWKRKSCSWHGLVLLLCSSYKNWPLPNYWSWSQWESKTGTCVSLSSFALTIPCDFLNEAWADISGGRQKKQLSKCHGVHHGFLTPQ